MANIENASPLTARLRVTGERLAGPIPPRIFGNFMEHLGFSADGGVLAHALANPTFEHDHRLKPNTVQELLRTGRLLVRFFQSGADPDVFPDCWSPGVGATGFGASVLDDFSAARVPFPWAPLGQDESVSPAPGRIGGGVRLRGGAWQPELHVGETILLDDGPSGVRQGVFLPFQRCLGYRGDLWVRMASGDPAAFGRVEVGLRRRLSDHARGRRAGECLALQSLLLQEPGWQKVVFHLRMAEERVTPGEPVDFFVRWLPADAGDLVLDRAMLLPDDAVEGIFDPDVLHLVKDWQVPLLRWPGGNFVSHYHWRDGVGPLDRRPTRPNYAWGGLETNFMGTGEFIRFCRLVGAEPHIAVNTGHGIA
jgi:alpha-L-arabinofuranosidase